MPIQWEAEGTVEGPPPFNPIDEPTLDWWIAADLSITGLSDDDPIVDVLDQSSAAKHYGQSSVNNRPTYKTNIVNGLPVMRFTDAVAGQLLEADPDPRTLGSANTLIMVCTKSTNDAYLIGGNGAESGPAFITEFGGTDFEYFFSGATERATFAASAAGFHILALTKTDGAGNYVGYFDGTQVFSNAVSGSADWNGRSLTAIGARIGGDYCNADIAEIIHCSSVVGASRLTDFHDYLGDKYAITVP